MANQKLPLGVDGKILLYQNEEGTFLALQDIDVCDVAEGIAESVAGKTLAMATEFFVDTAESYDFGCNYEWYKLEWCIVTDENGQMRLIASDFIGNVPGR